MILVSKKDNNNPECCSLCPKIFISGGHLGYLKYVFESWKIICIPDSISCSEMNTAKKLPNQPNDI